MSNWITAAAIVAAVAGCLAISIWAGSRLVRAELEGPEGRACSPARKTVLFLIGFVGWPVMICALVFILIFFWDLILYEDEFKKLDEKLSR